MGDRFQPPRPDVEPLDSVGRVGSGEPRDPTNEEGGGYSDEWGPVGIAVGTAIVFAAATICLLVLHWAGVL